MAGLPGRRRRGHMRSCSNVAFDVDRRSAKRREADGERQAVILDGPRDFGAYPPVSVLRPWTHDEPESAQQRV